jgi:hypothetical protein
VKTVFKSTKTPVNYLPACGSCLNEGGIYEGIFYWASVPTSTPRFDRDRSETTSLAAEYWVIVPTVVSV